MVYKILYLKDPDHWDVVFTRTWQNKPDIPQQAYLDFTILAKCNHSIISFGSFGFWSAYLRPKGVTLFLTNDYRRENINVNLINSKTSKDIQWIPWKDPCVTKVNNKWLFKNGTTDCVK